MGMCNCNPRAQVIIHADYSVPFNQEDKFHNQKYTNPQTKGISGTSFTTSTQSKNRSRINEESGLSQFGRTKRAALFQQISEKNSSLSPFNCGSLNVHGEANNDNCIKHIQRQLTPIESQQFDNFLKNYFFFKKLDHSELKRKLKMCSIDENKNLFLEGEEGRRMYIIISGKCELYKKGIEKVLIVNEWKTFGEMGVCDDNSLRTYSAKTLSKLTFFILESADYWNMRNSQTIEDYSYDISSMIQNIPFFSYLEDNDRENLSKFTYSLHLSKSKEIIKLNETFYIIKSGKLECYDSNRKYQITMEQKMYYGVKNLLLSENPTLHITPVEDSVIFIIPQKAFIEILGIDYQYNLIYPYFKHVMTNNEFFGNLFNELLLVPVFQLFKIKQYQAGSVVYPKNSKGKLIIIFEGELVFSGSSTEFDGEKAKTSIFPNEIFGEKVAFSEHGLECDIKAKYNTILLECEWGDMLEKIKTLNKGVIKKVRKLSMMEMMRGVSENKLIEIATLVKKEKFNKGDVIIQNGNGNVSEENVKFYLVITGEAKLRHRDKSIRRYGIGNAFGEVFTLNVQDTTDEIIASSDVLKVFSIEQKHFLNLIGESIFNDYIKHKMCNEDKEIGLNELFYSCKITDGISLVNNSDEFYFAKHFIKSKSMFDHVKQEIYSMKHLDHLFIQKTVKIIENNKYGVILYENIENGVYLSEIKNIPFKNKELVIFYCSCMILVLDYLQTKKLLHRNISIDNIIINKNGYPKLCNFSCAKKIKENYTKTLTGISYYTAPEILNNKPYSFPSDYWSLGMLVYYLYYQKYPFILDRNKSKEPMKIYNDIIKGNFDFSNSDNELKEVFTGLLCVNPEKRLSNYINISSLKLFSSVNFEDILAHKVKPIVNINPKKNYSNPKYKKVNYLGFLESEISKKAQEGANYANFKWSDSF